MSLTKSTTTTARNKCCDIVVRDELSKLHYFNADSTRISLEELWDLIGYADEKFKPLAELIFMAYYPIGEDYLFYRNGGMYTYAETVIFLDYYDKLYSILPIDWKIDIKIKFIKTYGETYLFLCRKENLKKIPNIK